MLRVWVTPERRWEEFGSSRFKVEWDEVRPEAADKEEIDIDDDIITLARYCATREEAIKQQQEVYDTKETAFGSVGMIEQVVGWFVEEDQIAEWQDVGEMEYLS